MVMLCVVNFVFLHSPPKAVSRHGRLHNTDYTDDFEGSTSQVVSSAPSTPTTTPPPSLQTLVNEMNQEQSRIPSVDTPLLTPVDSADEVRTCVC